MDTIKIKEANRELGRAQGYTPLWVRDTVITNLATKQLSPAMEAAFMPTPQELEKLNAGEPIILRILGTAWPPVLMEVGDDITEAELEKLRQFHRRLRANRIIENLRTTKDNY